VSPSVSSNQPHAHSEQAYVRQSRWDGFDRFTHKVLIVFLFLCSLQTKGHWRMLTVRTSQLGESLASLMVCPIVIPT
jgi:hypothetical protein